MDLNREKIVPHLDQADRVVLYPYPGRSICARQFAEEFLPLLSEYEQGIVRGRFSLLSDKIPESVKTPLSSVAPKEGDCALVTACSLGSRSVYWPERGLKLKACRPIPDLTFPHEELPFGSFEMKTQSIPFGVLSAEGAMREILAYCFLKKNRLPVLQRPIAVFEYQRNGKVAGYSLAMETPSEERLESREDFREYSIKDLIADKLHKHTLGGDVGFKGIDNIWYARSKARLLTKMHFSGGFRGFLNSNIGNDLIYQSRLYVCDFDTFQALELPNRPSDVFIRGFCTWAILEVLKTSPLVWGYEDVDGLSHEEAVHVIWDTYVQNSKLWRYYWEEFKKRAGRLGWDFDLVGQVIEEIKNTDLFFNVIIDNVVNSWVLKNTYDPKESFYRPHTG